MSSYDYTAAPRAVNVLPSRVSRRITRRDGLLPVVLVLELLVGVAFGIAGHAGASGASSVPAKLTLAPVALVTVVPSAVPVATVVPAAGVGPAVGPLLPGTVRAVVTAAPAAVVPAVRRHAARNPFGPLAR
ncbi:MAG: hypothetical protein JWP11_1689 [Frankiales bacterium]|nr:hypothetical protein [Frankiales bacterium]